MNILTLPDEMLTNILKYGEFAQISRLRKMNKRIDILAKRANITVKVSIELFELCDRKVHVSYSKEVASYLKIQKNHEFWLKKHSDHAIIMKNWLRKTQITGQLVIADVTIDFYLLASFMKYKQSLRHTKISLRKVKLALSPSEKNMFASILCSRKITELNLKENAADVLELIYNNKIFSNPKLQQLWITSSENMPFLDDSFLLNVATKCHILWLNLYKSSFTVNGVVNMLKKCIADRKRRHIIRCKFVGKLALGDTLFSDVENLFKRNIPNICFLAYGGRFTVNHECSVHNIEVDFAIEYEQN